jgi:LmbE family N-acetylglucosaminyl deacetylase
LQQIATAADIKRLGTILGMWAHPDDESFCMGAVIAAAVKNGQKVACVTATRGEAGVQDEARWPSAELAKIREQELAASLEVFGSVEHHWLPYHDGHCEEVSVELAVKSLISLIEQIQPDSIFTFGPDGLTGHPDHQAVSRWTDLAVKKLSSKKPAIYQVVVTNQQLQRMQQADKKHNIFFNIDKPPVRENGECAILFNPPSELADIKFWALEAQQSQTAIMIEEMGEKAYKRSFSEEAFVLAKP